MTVTKFQIVESIQNQTGFTKKRSSEIVEALLKIIKDTLASGESVMISNFGKFCVNHKGERRGRNPATGEDLVLEPRRVVTFKCSGKLRNRVDGKFK
ncbi:MAG: integration host factor subunit alpha [Desulfobacterales bacterium]